MKISNFLVIIFLLVTLIISACGGSTASASDEKKTSSVETIDASEIELFHGSVLDLLKGRGGITSIDYRTGKTEPLMRPPSRFDSQAKGPIYVVDGIIFHSSQDIEHIRASEVASIKILKGPSSATEYGVHGGNGAIVIETKYKATRKK